VGTFIVETVVVYGMATIAASSDSKCSLFREVTEVQPASSWQQQWL